jgi:hypothetical protein
MILGIDGKTACGNRDIKEKCDIADVADGHNMQTNIQTSDRYRIFTAV